MPSTTPRTSPFALALAAGALLAHPRDARANATQPDGTVIPAMGGAGVQPYLAMHGDGSIDVIAEASTTPETFMPHCHLTFTLVVHDAGDADEFGWYNVASGRAPAATELHRMLQGSQPPGTSATIDLALWTGGAIGFYMTNTTEGHTYYSQRAYNPDSTSTSGFVHMLTWNSHAMPSAFYFGWEDVFGSAGNDNDFNDMLVLVQGITCSGGGAACTVPGAMGACADGVQQCRAGALACVATATPSPERCDGADNDCNGTVDDGDGLCPTGQVCDRGVCVPHCVEGSCFAGQVCSPRGTCVEAACAMVDCPAGQRCVGGGCRAACDGVVCPHGQVCRTGACVDPCAGVMCDSDSVCVDGLCQPTCSCRPCDASHTCGADGRCGESACVGVMCPSGSYCSSGMCRDACDAVSCPSGQACSGGRCIDAPDAGASGVDAGGSDAGGSGFDGGGAHDAGATGTDASVVDGGRRRDGGGMVVGDDGGCGCRASGRSGARARGLGAIALIALAGLTSRRAARPRRGAARR